MLPPFIATVALFVDPSTDQVRRVLDALGLKVNRLIRTSYGPFQLGALERGAVEEVSGEVLREQLSRDVLSAHDEASGRGRR